MTKGASGVSLRQTTTPQEGPDAEVGEPRVASGVSLRRTVTLPERPANATEAEDRQTANLAEVSESTQGRRWTKGRHGRPVPKADTGNVDAVNMEMTRAFRHSPDVIANV